MLIGAQNTIKRFPNIRLVIEWDPKRWRSINVSVQDMVALLRSLELKPALVSSRGIIQEIKFDDLSSRAYDNVLLCHEGANFQ